MTYKIIFCLFFVFLLLGCTGHDRMVGICMQERNIRSQIEAKYYSVRGVSGPVVLSGNFDCELCYANETKTGDKEYTVHGWICENVTVII